MQFIIATGFVPSRNEKKAKEGETKEGEYCVELLTIYLFSFFDHVFFGLESVAGSVAGVQMTTDVSSSLCLSTLMTYPAIEHSAWTCFKDSSLRKLDKSWSVLWQNVLEKKYFLDH